MPLTLVLLPGLDGTSVLFEPLLEQLEVEAIVVSYPPTLPTDYADLLPLGLEALPRDREFVLLGWSFSGPLALMAAATRPAGLRGVVLSASFVQKPLAWIPSSVRFLAHAWLFHFSGIIARTKTRLSGHGSRSLLSLLARAHTIVPSKVMAARVRQVLVVDVREELKACSVPILYLGASQDWIVPKRNSAKIRAIKPSVELRFIRGPHMAMATHPVEAARELCAFMTRLESE